MEWRYVKERGQEALLYVSPERDYEGYPTGVGGRNSIEIKAFLDSDLMVELGRDWIGEAEGRPALMCRLMNERHMRVREVGERQGYLEVNWAKWQGGVVKHIYTDGSYATVKSVSQFLLGKCSKRAGGAIILSDGATWVHRIEVVIDVETTKAFDVELICILLANEIAVASDMDVTIHSDCDAALRIANGGYSEGFSNALGDWKKGANVTLAKVKAHPELHKPLSEWTWDDKGIWTADRVAGGEMESEGRISAKKWLTRISARAPLVIQEEDGSPFIGSVRDRLSRINMEKYWIERDGWRLKDGLEPKWEDHCTMLRLTAGKRWE